MGAGHGLGDPILAAGKYTITIGGGQPGTGASGVTGNFEVKGQVDLPEYGVTLEVTCVRDC